VYWWLFPAIGISSGILHANEVGLEQFLIHIGFTCSMITILLAFILAYYKIRFKSFNLTKAIGLGDILFLFALAIGFAPLSFITLLVFGLVFSLILHQLMLSILSKSESLDATSKSNTKIYKYEPSVPLAGYLGLYFMIVLFTDWFWTNLYLYQI